MEVNSAIDIDYKIIGQRIKKKRIELRETQEKIAKDLGVSVAYLSRVERGSSHVNLKRLVEISKRLRTPVDYFLTGVVKDASGYLSQEFKDTLTKCEPEKQRAILKIAKIISKMK